MDLANCNSARLLPTWMQGDEANEALCAVMDEAASQADALARTLSTWDRIDDLPEEMLDELAWALDISWWDSTASIEAKRSLIRESDYVHSKLGTVAAMESVAKSYLDDGRAIEWFEYGGEPHHFKIATGNLQMLNDNRERLMERIFKAKRHSSKLDSILVLLAGRTPVNTGVRVRERGRVGVRIWDEFTEDMERSQ